MRIEVFYIAGCPNAQPTVERVAGVLKDLGITAEIVQLPVSDPASASAIRFLGSPTIHVNGVDAEPSARTFNQFGLMCRTYLEGPRSEGVPSTGLIRQALLEALSPREPKMGETR
ncbi:MAG: hypothetical protein DMG57_01570 [Acidobacteria bacterium]|nr:MAG: hypothetical protein DMG57_01570 [Acidobacteriota bacterium]